MAAKQDLQIVHDSYPDGPDGSRSTLRESGARPHRGKGALPAQPNPLLGRDKELEALSQALLSGMVRLLTLTGPSGVGKTRLAIEVAMTVYQAFRDGAYFVDLTDAASADLVPPTLAAVLGVVETETTTTLSRLLGYLTDRHLLLLLDNLDHVPTAATSVGEIVARCPHVTVIVTSRTPLYLRWEHVQPIAPLHVPESGDMPLQDLAELPCIQLFMQRAQAVRPDFALTHAHAQDILEICRRLDGIPLAVEIAAARTNILVPSAIVNWLDRPESLLQQTAADIPARHRSLDAAMASTYGLLDERERSLLFRLAVFIDGFTIEEATAVVGAHELNIHILDGLSSLVDKGLIARNGESADEPRFSLLQTIDSYVLDQARAEGKLQQVREAHCTYFLGLAEQAAFEQRGPQQELWLSRLEREHGNLHAAHQWARQVGSEKELRLALALGEVGRVCGDPAEGAQRLSDALIRRPNAPVALRLDALNLLGHLFRIDGRFESARLVLDEGLTLARSFGAAPYLARLLMTEGLLLTAQGMIEDARVPFDEALALWRDLNDIREIALIIQYQGVARLMAGSPAQAETLLAESLSIFQSVEDLGRVIVGLLLLARAAGLQGHTSRAADLVEQALTMGGQLRLRGLMLLGAELVAWLAAPLLRPEAVGRLLGAIAGGRKETGFRRDPMDGTAFEDAQRSAKARSGEESVSIWIAAGEELSFDQMINEAYGLLAQVRTAAAEARTPRIDTGKLSRREYEVLQLVAQGLSNKQIAQQLTISENTAKYHVTSILNKLGADSRARIVALAAQLNLLQTHS